MWSSANVLLSPAARERCVIRLRRQPSWKPDKDKNPKIAAVLIPLCIVDDNVSILYTVRSTLLKNHSGQISFPGGMAEPGETVEQTALRETEEELGLSRKRVEVWGAGGIIPGRDASVMVTPVVGYIPDYKQSELSPNAHEVEEVFTVPITALCDPQNQGYTTMKNINFIIPVFTYGKHKIWGLTAIMTHMFLSSLIPKEHYSNNCKSNHIDSSKL